MTMARCHLAIAALAVFEHLRILRVGDTAARTGRVSCAERPVGIFGAAEAEGRNRCDQGWR